MAKYERRFSGNFDSVLNRLHNNTLNSGFSVTFEDGSEWRAENVRCAVRVYERYSFIGGNRLSLTVTLVGQDEKLFLSAITAGGSCGMLFKINTWGEGAFLDSFQKIAERL